MFTYSLIPSTGKHTVLTRAQFIALLPLRSGAGSTRYAGWYRRWTLATMDAAIQVTRMAAATVHCDWCDAPIDTENSTSELCDDCSAVECTYIEAEEARTAAYWRHIDQQIDESMGK
jgi:hypothetical protein